MPAIDLGGVGPGHRNLGGGRGPAIAYLRGSGGRDVAIIDGRDAIPDSVPIVIMDAGGEGLGQIQGRHAEDDRHLLGCSRDFQDKSLVHRIGGIRGDVDGFQTGRVRGQRGAAHHRLRLGGVREHLEVGGEFQGECLGLGHHGSGFLIGQVQGDEAAHQGVPGERRVEFHPVLGDREGEHQLGLGRGRNGELDRILSAVAVAVPVTHKVSNPVAAVLWGAPAVTATVPAASLYTSSPPGMFGT